MKPVVWNDAAKRDILDLPAAVRKEFGHELYLLQCGDVPENASPFEGSTGGDTMKIVERFDGDTYRCVYAAKLETAIYVLHCYMKKATEGKKTPKRIIETVHARFASAKQQDMEARKAVEDKEQKEKGN